MAQARQRLHAIPCSAAGELPSSTSNREGVKRTYRNAGAVFEPRKRQVEVVRTFQRLSIARRARLTLAYHLALFTNVVGRSEFRYPDRRR